VRWNLDWMLTMQDPADGGVYHKLTTLQFSGTVMPAVDRATRYVMMKTVTASYDFAGVMAQAALQYSRLGKHEDAGRFYDAAKAAFAWAEKNPGEYYVQPDDVGTGTYADNNSDDERIWAAVALAQVQGDTSYLRIAGESSWTASVPWWGGVAALGAYEATMHKAQLGETLATGAQAAVLTSAKELLTASQASGYGIATKNFVWGSNSQVANEGIQLLYGYYLTGEAAYLQAAQAHLDYLLGRNPLAMSYVTGFGSKSPLHPHHRPSEADKVTAPVPGMLVGGPHGGGDDVGTSTWSCPEYRVDGRPARSYIDDDCSYATNEVAINWNAPLAYLAGAMYSLQQGVERPTSLRPEAARRT